MEDVFNAKFPFTAAQAAQKSQRLWVLIRAQFTAAQAAQKTLQHGAREALKFTAAQAAQKAYPSMRYGC